MLRTTLVALASLLALPIAGSAATIRVISLPVKDLVYDQARQRIYASVPSSGGARANTVTLIDPSTGALGPSVFVGSEPGKLAMSDDGQYLYVGLDGAGAVRRVHLPSLTAGLQFSVGTEPFFGTMFAEDIAVLPGAPQAVAISRRFVSVSPRHAGVAVYDDGVQRPTATSRHTGSNVIEFGSSAAVLYGYNNESTEYGYRRNTVSASGVSVLDVTESLITGFDRDIEFSGGRIYATSGQVIDPDARVLLGTFSASGPLESDAVAGRTFFISGNSLVAFDNATFAPLGSLSIPIISGTPASLIRWGADGFAFRTTAGQVILLQSVLVSCQPGSCVDRRASSPFDVDGDGMADVGIYRQIDGSGRWIARYSGAGSVAQDQWGCVSCDDFPVPGDYDGDGRMDFAVYRFPTGEWFVLLSSNDTLLYQRWGCGSCGDFPVPADYDGDGKTDIAVHRVPSGEWFVVRSSNATVLYRQWGCGACGDLPVPADYDGDGRADTAVYRYSSGEWFVVRSSNATLLYQQWGCGACSDFPIPADYDGDTKADFAVYRFPTAQWLVLRSSDATLLAHQWGCVSCGDLPVPADYDGDGKTEVAVYRASTGQWFYMRSSDAGNVQLVVGPVARGDIPLELPPVLAFDLWLQVGDEPPDAFTGEFALNGRPPGTGSSGLPNLRYNSLVWPSPRFAPK